MAMAEVLREKRKARGLTQEQVANYLGITTPAVNKWEKGLSCPDLTLLPVLARLLKTDPNTLLGFQENLSDLEVTLFLNDAAQNRLCSAKDHADVWAILCDVMLVANLPDGEQPRGGFTRHEQKSFRRPALGRTVFSARVDSQPLCLRVQLELARRGG